MELSWGMGCYLYPRLCLNEVNMIQTMQTQQTSRFTISVRKTTIWSKNPGHRRTWYQPTNDKRGKNPARNHGVLPLLWKSSWWNTASSTRNTCQNDTMPSIVSSRCRGSGCPMVILPVPWYLDPIEESSLQWSRETEKCLGMRSVDRIEPALETS